MITEILERPLGVGNMKLNSITQGVKTHAIQSARHHAKTSIFGSPEFAKHERIKQQCRAKLRELEACERSIAAKPQALSCKTC